MRSQRIVVLAGLGLALVVPLPASATVTGAATVTLQIVPGGFKACGIGNAADPYVGGEWVFTINGVVAGRGTGQAFQVCVLVARTPSPGILMAGLSFAGASGTPADYDSKGFIW